MKIRKTMDVWDIQTNFGSGWETECTEFNRKNAQEQLNCYRVNSYGQFSVRMQTRRELIKKLYYYGAQSLSCFPFGNAGQGNDKTGKYLQIVVYGWRLPEKDVEKYKLEFIREEEVK